MLDEATVPVAVPIVKGGEFRGDAPGEGSPRRSLELFGTRQVGVSLAMIFLEASPMAFERLPERGRVNLGANVAGDAEIRLDYGGHEIDKREARVEENGGDRSLQHPSPEN